MRTKDGSALSFYSLFIIFCYIFRFNTTDYFWSSVIDLIRKYYSRKEGRERKRVRGLSLATCSHTPILRWGGGARTATVLQHHHNILHCHNITGRWKEGGVCVSWGFPWESREWEERSKEGEVVVCQTLQQRGFQSKEMSCASALPGTAWGACGCCCCCGGCCCCCCWGPPGGATYQNRISIWQDVEWGLK